MSDDEATVGADLVRPARTHAGVDEVARAVSPARRVFLVNSVSDLAPRRLTKRRARQMLASLKSGSDTVVVTARVEGSDLVIRTLEWLGDAGALGIPIDPVKLAAAEATRRGAAPAAPAAAADSTSSKDE